MEAAVAVAVAATSAAYGGRGASEPAGVRRRPVMNWSTVRWAQKEGTATAVAALLSYCRLASSDGFRSRLPLWRPAKVRSWAPLVQTSVHHHHHNHHHSRQCSRSGGLAGAGGRRRRDERGRYCSDELSSDQLVAPLPAA